MKLSPLFDFRGLLKPVLDFSHKNKIQLYLVGGILRDTLINRRKEILDFDFCLESGAVEFAQKLAKQMMAGFVLLDDAHGSCRVVKKTKDGYYTLDFTDFRGKSLKDDLHHRDFTVNCLALSLETLFEAREEKDLQAAVIDPWSGLEDLDKKIVRVVNKSTFDEDPLRLMRAFSLAANFNFKIDPLTKKLINLKSKKLKIVSLERIRDELFKLFSLPESYAWISALDKAGLLKIIFPEFDKMRGKSQGPYHHLNIFAHTLESLSQFDKVIAAQNKNKEISAYLKEEISSGRKRTALIKLAVLLHDIGKPATMRKEGKKLSFHGHERVGMRMAQEISKRLKLSNEEIQMLSKVILWHLRPGYLADNAVISARAKFRFFRDAGKEAGSVLLLSVADQRATKGRLSPAATRLHHEKIAFNLLKEYFKKQKEEVLVKLVNGNDIISSFKLSPSPLIGVVLKELEELQAIGKIKTKEEALIEAKKIIQNEKKIKNPISSVKKNI